MGYTRIIYLCVPAFCFQSLMDDRAGGIPMPRNHPSPRRPVLEIWPSDFRSLAKESSPFHGIQGNMRHSESWAHLRGSNDERAAEMAEGHEARPIAPRRSSCSSLPPPLSCIPANISTRGKEPIEPIESPSPSGRLPSRRVTINCQLPELRAATAAPREQGRESRPARMKHSGSMPSLPTTLSPKQKPQGRSRFNTMPHQPKRNSRDMSDPRIHGSCPQLEIC